MSEDTLHGFISCSEQLLAESGSGLDVAAQRAKLLERLDVRELYIHLGPLVWLGKGLTTEAWATTLAVGVGMASLEAKRLEDTKGEITGVLRDYPSVFCTLTMEVDENVDANRLLLYLKHIHLELNGAD